MRFLESFLAAIFVAFLLATPVLAVEDITDFKSATTLRTDGSVDVTETIAVNAEGDLIKHGIFRDIFTTLLNKDGSKFYADLGVVAVNLDGKPEPYEVDGIGNGKRIKIGDADTLLADGPHTYVIHYTMTRIARFFADHDEIYWNATGNYWDFPIEKATATLALPAGARISQLAVYTGAVGATGKDATVTQDSDTAATFVSTKPLQPGEGMTIAAAFQHGVVAAPTGSTASADWLSDHRELLLPPLAVLIVLLYNLFAWLRVGRDPRRGTIIPLFHPPEGLSPATAQWVRRMGFKGSGWNALTATLFDLGVKGLVTVDNRDKLLTVTGTGNRPAAPLPTDEQVLYDYFGGHNARTLDKATGPTLNSLRVDMLAAISKPNKGAWFRLNIGYIVVGMLLAVAAIGAMVGLDVLDPSWLVVAIGGGVVIGVIFAIVRAGTRGSVFSLLFGVVWLAIFAGNAIVTLSRATMTSLPVDPAALAAISIVAITMMFAFIMRAPTVAGRKLMDQIDGFVMYLNTAEKNRLNIDGEPPLTIRRFEALLPFAIALGVEKPWSDRFNAALAAGQVADATGTYYAPVWYSGRDFSSNSLSNNIAAISTGMAAAMASAVPASSSSSGVSGGSSGGGGGGGGGGGW